MAEFNLKGAPPEPMPGVGRQDQRVTLVPASRFWLRLAVEEAGGKSWKPTSIVGLYFSS